MKKKKNKHLASQFPSIYRLITENKVALNIKKSTFRLLNQSKSNKLTAIVLEAFIFLFGIVLISAILLFLVNLYGNVLEFNKISSQRQQIQSQINFWESISNKYEGYKDAYFRIALLEYRLGNLQKAEEFNKKALLLDPNFVEAKKLEAVLSK